MNTPTLVLLVRLKSDLSYDALMEIAESRIDEFRALEGLRQKYYLYDEAAGELAGLYFWDSKEAFDEFAKSKLRATIAEAYQAVEEPRVEVYRIVEVLRD